MMIDKVGILGFYRSVFITSKGTQGNCALS